MKKEKLILKTEKPVQENFLGANAVYHCYATLPDSTGRAYNEEQCALEFDRVKKCGLKIARTFFRWYGWDAEKQCFDWENEPDIDKELLKMVDIATPHIAGYSADGKWNATRMSLETINDFFNLKKDPIKLLPIIEPEKTTIDLSNIGNDKQLAKALLYSYDPLKDSALLKESPEKFYYFRSHYPLRREYIAYSIANADSKTASSAKGLGFNIE